VRDVAGVEPEDFLTIARRYVGGPESRRTAGNFMRELWKMMLIGVTPAHRLDRFARLQQHPQPAHPRLAGESAIWQHEHAPVDPSDGRYGVIRTHPGSFSQRAG
jgi:hypothetical protein